VSSWGREGAGQVSGRFDVVVVGAGPAGSIAALVLARSGARVALADKAAFPRDKACGDLVGPRGVQVLADLGLRVPDAGQGSDLLAVGPSGRRSRLPAFTGRTYPGHGIIVPRLALDHALREAALQAGAVPVRARITAVEAGGDGRVDAVISSDGQRLAGEVIIAADGALSPVARLAGMRMRQQLASGQPGPDGSAVKLTFALLNQEISGFEIELAGADGLTYDDWTMRRAGSSDYARGPAYRYLRSKGNSIEGGTSEILRNIIAERVLGLPPEPRTDTGVPWKDLPR